MIACRTSKLTQISPEVHVTLGDYFCSTILNLLLISVNYDSLTTLSVNCDITFAQKQ